MRGVDGGKEVGRNPASPFGVGHTDGLECNWEGLEWLLIVEGAGTLEGARTLGVRAKSGQAGIHANTSLIGPAHDRRATHRGKENRWGSERRGETEEWRGGSAEG